MLSLAPGGKSKQRVYNQPPPPRGDVPTAGQVHKHVRWHPRCLFGCVDNRRTTHLIQGKKGRITILINGRPASSPRPHSSWTNSFG